MNRIGCNGRMAIIGALALLMALALACGGGAPATAPATAPQATAPAPTATTAPAPTATPTLAPTAMSATPTAAPTTAAPTQPPATPVAPTPAPTTAPAAEQPAASGGGASIVLGEGSVARYKVEEVLAGTGFFVATGETSDVSGRIALDADGQVIADESAIVVQAATLKTDSDRRDGYVRDRVLRVGEYPEIVFVPAAVDGLPADIASASGHAEFTISGDLTILDQTRPVVWNATADINGGAVGSAYTEFTFDDFGMNKPSVRIVLSVEDTIRLEIDFAATIERAAAMDSGGEGEPAYANAIGDPDAPVTVVEYSDFQ